MVAGGIVQVAGIRHEEDELLLGVLQELFHPHSLEFAVEDRKLREDFFLGGLLDKDR